VSAGSAVAPRRWILVLWLTIVWVALWGEVSVANVLSGVAVSAVLLLLFPSTGAGGYVAFRPLRVLQFLGYFAYKLVEANLIVAWEVLTPNNEGVNEAIVAVPVTGTSDTVLTLVANAISLTPGTLTIDVRRNPAVLYVHVLHLRSLAQTRQDVRRLELHALRAFGTEHALRRAREWTTHDPDEG
jgi:multicomponent Na+:H+ antiporter subunit E